MGKLFEPQQLPPGTRCTSPLHGILPVLRTRYVYRYNYGYIYGAVHLCCSHNRREHWTAASISRKSLHQVSGASAIIGIQSSVIAAISDRIQLTILDLIKLNCFFFGLIRLNCVSVWLDSIYFSVWLGSIFYLIKLNYFSIWVTQLRSYSSQAKGSTTLSRVSLKYSNTENVEYSTILIIEVMFGQSTLTK